MSKHLNETEERIRQYEENQDIVDFYFNEWDRQYDERRITYYKHLNEVIHKFVVPKLVLPKGYIVELGTNKCELFLELCEHYGEENCRGYDLENPLELDNIEVVDVRELDEELPIALSINDVGGWALTPESRMAAYQWAKKNTVLDGYLIESRSAIIPADELGDFDCFEDLLSSGFEEIHSVENWHVFKKIN